MTPTSTCKWFPAVLIVSLPLGNVQLPMGVLFIVKERRIQRVQFFKDLFRKFRLFFLREISTGLAVIWASIVVLLSACWTLNEKHITYWIGAVRVVIAKSVTVFTGRENIICDSLSYSLIKNKKLKPLG